MLAIKKETDYAIRCVYYLASRNGEIIMADEIAAIMLIPRCFLAKIMQKLAKAGIVKSYVGIKGGHSLAKNPGSISLYEVILTIEGPVAMNSCTIKKGNCAMSDVCLVHPIWLSVKKDVERVLSEKTFANIG
jgi:Rrf2 family protein